MAFLIIAIGTLSLVGTGWLIAKVGDEWVYPFICAISVMLMIKQGFKQKGLPQATSFSSQTKECIRLTRRFKADGIPTVIKINGLGEWRGVFQWIIYRD